MGLTIAKKQTATKPAAKPAVKTAPAPVIKGAIPGYEVEVDRAAALITELAPFKSKFKELADLEKKLRDAADAVTPADKEAAVLGTEGRYFKVTERAKARNITSMAEVRKLMGEKLFMECATVTLGDIDKYVPKADQPKIITETQTGSRKGSLVLPLK